MVRNDFQQKIAILLADSDALRRDGMTAAVQSTGCFDVVAQCADGVAALAGIRSKEPEVAIIDLNLPKLQGIEVVRLARGESLRTKIIVASVSDDADIVREVVRAGGDGFLLKSGPARHLLDAINYVRDGGQYFSPDLRLGGVAHELLQERTQAALDRTEAPPKPVSGAQAPVRERLRQSLEDREYQVLSKMAEGIRPILDSLDYIEGRVSGMETGTEPVPSDPRTWLSKQLADSLRGNDRPIDVAQSGRSVRELEARLPKLVEETVSQRFRPIADKLQHEIEETHIKTLETFIKNIQVKLLNRVSALERDMAVQADNLKLLRESSQRTEENLSRLIAGVDKLAQRLPTRLQTQETGAVPVPPRQPSAVQPSSPPAASIPDATPRRVKAGLGDRSRTSRSNGTLLSNSAARSNSTVKIFWGGIVAALLVASLWTGMYQFGKRPGSSPGSVDARTVEVARPVAPPPGADAKTKLDAAREFVRRKEYPAAEGLYRQVIQSEPANVNALKGLASALYRQDKIEESAAILDKVPAQ